MKDIVFEQAVKAELDKINDIYSSDLVKPVAAPFNTLGKEIISKIPDVSGNILVFSDCGLLLSLYLRILREKKSLDSIVFIAHTDKQEQFANDLKIKTINVGYENPIKELENQLMGMKFDIVVANPPYGNLHLSIMRIALERLTPDGVYLSVQPVRWLQDPLWREKRTSDAKKMQDVVDGKLESVEIIPARDASKLFGATFGFDLAIFVIKNGGGKFSYDAIAQTPKGIDISPFMNILVDTGFRFDAYDGEMLHFVPISTIAAAVSGGFDGSLQGTHMHQPNYGYFSNGVSNDCKYGNGLTLAQAHKANTRRTMGKTIGAVVKSFSTADEARNFYEFLKLDVFRFFVYVTTLDVNIQCKFLPFPKEKDAFVVPWDAQRFCEYFNISAHQRKYIEDVMKSVPVK